MTRYQYLVARNRKRIPLDQMSRFEKRLLIECPKTIQVTFMRSLRWENSTYRQGDNPVLLCPWLIYRVPSSLRPKGICPEDDPD